MNKIKYTLINEKFLDLVAEKDLLFKDVAEELRISSATISRYMRGGGALVDIAKSMAEFLEVPFKTLWITTTSKNNQYVLKMQERMKSEQARCKSVDNPEPLPVRRASDL